MIVVDTNVLVALLLNNPLNEAAERLLTKDGDWNAPILWRSEFRNVLATHMRLGKMTHAEALAVQQQAESLMRRGEHDVDSSRVLELTKQSGCTAYDCEFIDVALRLGAPLYTRDKLVLQKFPKTARTYG